MVRDMRAFDWRYIHPEADHIMICPAERTSEGVRNYGYWVDLGAYKSNKKTLKLIDKMFHHGENSLYCVCDMLDSTFVILRNGDTYAVISKRRLEDGMGI